MTASCSCCGRRRNGVPGRQHSISRTVAAPMPQEPDSRTAPLPAQARSPSASWAASGCGQATLGTSGAPARVPSGRP
jgi:hypothetical protein